MSQAKTVEGLGAGPAAETRASARAVVTVAIPAYNPGEFFRVALASVLTQSFRQWELVISDDSLTDGVREFLRDLMRRDERFQYLRNARRLGLVGNFTRCAGLGSGRYVTIFHQDDVMLPTNLEAKARVLEAHPRVGMVYSSVQRIDRQGKVLGGDGNESETEVTILTGREFLERMVREGNFVCAPSVMVRRSVFQEVGPFDPRLRYACDWDMWMRVALRHDVAVLGTPQILYRYHDHMESARWMGTLGELREVALLFRILFRERAPDLAADRGMRMAAQRNLCEKALQFARAAWRQGARGRAIRMRAFALAHCPGYVLRRAYWRALEGREALRKQDELGRG